MHKRRLDECSDFRNRTINIDLSLAEVIKKQDGADKRKEKIDGHMEKYKARLQIYTDAAKSEDGKVTAAYHIPEIGVHYSCRITDNTSVDTAELFAIQQSSRWIKKRRKLPVEQRKKNRYFQRLTNRPQNAEEPQERKYSISK